MTIYWYTLKHNTQYGINPSCFTPNTCAKPQPRVADLMMSAHICTYWSNQNVLVTTTTVTMLYVLELTYSTVAIYQVQGVIRSIELSNVCDND